MFSRSTIDTLDVIRRASLNNELALVSSRLASTGEPVVVIAAMTAGAAAVSLTPLAMLKPAATPYLDETGRVNEAAIAVFASLRREINSDAAQAWFTEDAEGRVHVGFARLGSRGDPAQTLLTLPWGNPCKLFAEPARIPEIPGVATLSTAARGNPRLH